MPNFMKELHITGLNSLIGNIKLNAKQNKAINNIKSCADNKWEYVNGWYDEENPDYRNFVLSPKKVYNEIYSESLMNEYDDEGTVRFGDKNIKDIRFCGKMFLRKVAFYYTIDFVNDSFDEVNGTKDDETRIIKELQQIRKEMEDFE